MPSRQLAKMAVALRMCELLYKAGKCTDSHVYVWMIMMMIMMTLYSYVPGMHLLVALVETWIHIHW